MKKIICKCGGSKKRNSKECWECYSIHRYLKSWNNVPIKQCKGCRNDISRSGYSAIAYKVRTFCSPDCRHSFKTPSPDRTEYWREYYFKVKKKKRKNISECGVLAARHLAKM